MISSPVSISRSYNRAEGGRNLQKKTANLAAQARKFFYNIFSLGNCSGPGILAALSVSGQGG
jgi:hypothetical protein